MAKTPNLSLAAATGPQAAPDDEAAIDAAVLARVDAIVRDLQGNYIAWSEQEVARMQEACEAAELLAPERRAGPMGNVFAISHDIKGSGGSFHFDLMTVLGRELCRFVEHRSVFEDADLAVVRCHLEAMREVLANRLTDDGGAAGRAVLDRLGAVLSTP